MRAVPLHAAWSRRSCHGGSELPTLGCRVSSSSRSPLPKPLSGMGIGIVGTHGAALDERRGMELLGAGVGISCMSATMSSSTFAARAACER